MLQAEMKTAGLGNDIHVMTREEDDPIMHSEQSERFDSIHQLVNEAEATIETIRSLVATKLTSVENDSSQQAACLQKIQQQAGVAVQALTDVSEVARRARSYQAQHHQQG